MKNIFIKIFSSFSIFLLLFSFYFTFADEIETDDADTNIQVDINETVETVSNPASPLTLNARSCIVLDRLSKKVLYGKNELNKVKMASTTKIMTSIVIIENCNLNETVEVSKKAASIRGSRLGLKTGDKITVRDLLYGLMLCSGNDAAIALAEHTGGSVSGFCDLMNAKAKELGLTNSHFESPHGLDSNLHYTTAYELALLADYALNNNTFKQIVGTTTCTVTINGNSKNIKNTNELLGVLNGVYGVKTGFTNGANRCLVTACKRGNMDIICVVLGCDTKKFRTTDSIKLIEYAFKNFEYVNIAELIDKEFTNWQNENKDYFNILKGINSDLQIKYSNIDTEVIPINKEYTSSIKVNFFIEQLFEAPVHENDVIGKIDVSCNNEHILQLDILSINSIDKKNFYNYLLEFLRNYSEILNSVTN